MEPTENIKSLLKKLNFEADPQVHQRILDDALAVQAKAKTTKSMVGIVNRPAETKAWWKKGLFVPYPIAASVLLIFSFLILTQFLMLNSRRIEHVSNRTELASPAGISMGPVRAYSEQSVYVAGTGFTQNFKGYNQF
jgi:hypothetical protein